MLTQTRSVLKKVIEKLLNVLGFALVRKQISVSMPTWSERLKLTKQLGFSPKVIVDGGAFRGLWSREAAEIFPGIQLIVVEPNPFVQKDIKSNISNIYPSPEIFDIALGDHKGKATLRFWQNEKSDTGASLLDHVSGKALRTVEVKVDTLDNLVIRTGQIPDLVKLDLQGAELVALKGAQRILEHTELVIIEFGCLEAYEGRATPRDIMDVMYKHDYCLYDIVDCHYRPFDGALTGGDFIFVKNSSILRKHKGWL